MRDQYWDASCVRILGLSVLDPVVGRMLGFWMGWEKWAGTWVLWRTFQKQSDMGRA